MGTPERLSILTSPRNEPLEIKINPSGFSMDALKEIVLAQVHSLDPREIIIERGEKTAVILSNGLAWAKNYDENTQAQLAGLIAYEMWIADSVTIREIARKAAPKNIPQGKITSFRNTFEEFVDNNAPFARFVNESPAFKTWARPSK